MPFQVRLRGRMIPNSQHFQSVNKREFCDDTKNYEIRWVIGKVNGSIN